MKLWKIVANVQAVFYVVTGLWPLLHMPSFVKVTGPKTDIWLVRTVGVLITVIGATLALGTRRGPNDTSTENAEPDITLLAMGSAAGLTAIDLIYVSRRRISRIYLLDAVAEIALIVAWILSRRTPSSK